MVHQWVQEDWFHRCDSYIFNGSVQDSVTSKERLFLLNFFSSYHLLLGGSNFLWLIAWIVRGHKFIACLCYVFLFCNRQSQVFVPASSKVRHNICRISTNQSMYIDQCFSCPLSMNLRKLGRWKLFAASCPFLNVSLSWWG